MFFEYFKHSTKFVIIACLKGDKGSFLNLIFSIAFICFILMLLLNFILKRGSFVSFGSKSIEREHKCSLPETLFLIIKKKKMY